MRNARRIASRIIKFGVGSEEREVRIEKAKDIAKLIAGLPEIISASVDDWDADARSFQAVVEVEAKKNTGYRGTGYKFEINNSRRLRAIFERVLMANDAYYEGISYPSKVTQKEHDPVTNRAKTVTLGYSSPSIVLDFSV